MRVPPGLIAHLRRLGLWKALIAPVIVLTAGAWLVREVTGVATSGNASSSNATPPRDIIEQVRQREFWVSAPRTFSAATASWVAERSVAVLPDDDPVLLTPEELAEHGAAYEDKNVMLVGRVAENVSLTIVRFHGYDGISDEIRLVGANETGTYLGVNGGHPITANLRGKTVITVGRIAALGIAWLPNGKEIRAAYLLVAGGGRGIASVTVVTSAYRYRYKLRPSGWP
jgi:hypothetical protein